MERGIGKLIGQEAESGNICGPPETRGDKLSEGDLERVARLRALHVDWPGHGIDTAEVKRRHVGGRRAAFEMPVAGVQALEVDGLARLAPQRRREVAAPGEIMVLAMDRMVAGDAHGMSFKSCRTEKPLPCHGEAAAGRYFNSSPTRGSRCRTPPIASLAPLGAGASSLPAWVARAEDEAGRIIS